MKEIALPPHYCSPICDNSMNDLCIERCAIKRDMSAFKLKKGIELPDLPPFPTEDCLSGSVSHGTQHKLITLYVGKIVDFLQGKKEENGTTIFHTGPIPYLSRRERNAEGIQGHGILYHAPDETPEDRKKSSGKTIGVHEVDGKTK